MCHARPDAMLAFVELSRRVSPGRFTEYARGRPIQWATYLVRMKYVHLAMREAAVREAAVREAAAGTNAPCFSGSSALNGPVPVSSYAGTCIQVMTGDPALADSVMSGAIWARCLVTP